MLAATVSGSLKDANCASTKTEPEASYRTKRGSMFCGDSRLLLSSSIGDRLRGKVQLIFTSPPFSLNHKKKYGNLQGEEIPPMAD